jgi:hypothetical protein
MNTDFEIDKVTEIISGCETMNDCGNASNVIDLYAKRHTGYFYKTIIKGFRNDLCDKTFDTYLEKYKV